MALDWDALRQCYGQGAWVPTGANNGIHITEVGDEHLHIRSRLWSDVLHRQDLQKAVLLIEDGTLPDHAVPDKHDSRSFAEGYRHHVADARGSMVAYILKDLGHLR